MGPSCHGHLWGHGSFTLKFGLVPFKGLLSAVFEFVAVVVFGQAVYTAELCTAVRTLSDYAKNCRVAWSLSLKLTTFLGSHDVYLAMWRLKGVRNGRRVGPRCKQRCLGCWAGGGAEARSIFYGLRRRVSCSLATATPAERDFHFWKNLFCY